ncbi:MAG: Methanol dehydrogenase activator [Phycisphaerae bacterium]|nr:Methanol dehydrogenase activator [Phycisphaerae bacterium]
MRLVARGHWEFAERIGCRAAVVIVAVSPDGRLLLVEQHRVPLRRDVIELPAGLVGDDGDADEPIADAARRELREETGYEAAGVEELMFGPTSAGFSTEVVHFVRATGLRRVADGGGVGHERIRVHEVPLADAAGWLEGRRAAGVLIDPKVYAGVYFATAAPDAARHD